MFVPCGFLWLLSPLEYMMDKRHPARNVPTSWLFLAKLTATAVLVALAAAELGNDIWLQGKSAHFITLVYSLGSQVVLKVL